MIEITTVMLILGEFADFFFLQVEQGILFYSRILFGHVWMRKEQIVFGLDSEKGTSWVVEETTVVF